MGPLHLSLPILIAVIVLLRYSGLWRRPRRKRAETRPTNRHPIDELRPQTEHKPVEDPAVEPGHQDPNDELLSQAEYEPVEEPDVELAIPKTPCQATISQPYSIIAVHGLGSNADWSWTWQREGEKSVEWLKDPSMLPGKVKRARILRYNYHSRWDVNAPDTCLEECGRTLIRRIHNFRADKKDRPLIFIGHSLGGLVIEYGLLWADSEPEFRYFTHYTVGCIFLGCPFIGSKMQFLARIAAFFLSAAGSQIGLVEKISYENDDLFQKLTAFCNLTRRALLPVSCFYEKYNTDYGRKIGIPWILAGKVVNKFSASVQTGKILPLDTDHLNLNKFCGSNDRSFVDVAAEIVEMYKNIGTLLKDRRTYWHEQHLMVPFGRNEAFVGRKHFVQQLLDRIPPDAISDTCQRTALQGLGGVGKTQVAIEAIYQFHHQDPNCSIFWVPAITSEAFEDAYRDIGRKLKIPGIDKDNADVKSLVKEALEKQDVGRWLLVVDNADDTKLLFQGVSLANYLPFNRNGSILFTTRNRHAVSDLQATRIQVEPMDKSEASKLLGSGNLDLSLVDGRNADSTEKLLCLLTNLPLAIRQASDYLNKNQIPSTEYVEIYQSSEDDMIYLLSWTFETNGRYDDAENPIITTYFTSFRQIQGLDSLAVDYLRLMSFLADHEIHREILPSESGGRSMTEAIGKLAAYAFVSRREIGQFVCYDIHRLVQASARAWMRENDKKGGREWDEFSKRALKRLEDVFPFPDLTRQDAWTSYLAHAKSALEFQLETDREKANVLLQKIEDRRLSVLTQGGGQEEIA